MKKSTRIRIVCLIVASAVLVGTAAAALAQGSPYELLKDAVFGMMTLLNYTETSEMTTTVNGAVIEQTKSHSVNSESRVLRYYNDDFGNPDGFFYDTGTLNIIAYGYRKQDLFIDGTQWYSASISGSDSGYRNSMADEFNRGSASMRFTELLIDLIVGDLKNNLTMTSHGDTRTVSGIFTESQIPEIVKAGIDMLMDTPGRAGDRVYNREDYTDKNPLEVPMREFTLNRFSFDVDVNPDGIMTGFRIDCKMTIINVFGDVNDVEYNGYVRISDIGTSNPVCPIPGAEKLLTVDYAMEHFGASYVRSVYFTLRDDGSIDPGSVTTTHPREQDAEDDELIDTDLETH